MAGRAAAGRQGGAAPDALPLYELRVSADQRGRLCLEVWQLPSPATPRVTAPVAIATLQGAALLAVEHRILKRLARARVEPGRVLPGTTKTNPIPEELALRLGLIFRSLAPMRNADRIRRVADSIDDMSHEEASYWLGMVLHRGHPRRVLAALRMLADAD